MAVETIILPAYAPPGALAGFWRSIRERVATLIFAFPATSLRDNRRA